MIRLMTRRFVVRTLAGSFTVIPAGRAAFAQQPAAVPARPPAFSGDQVQQFVRVAHGDIDATRTMIEAEPRLIRVAWDWGGGDVETALGGAAHMGRRDIATLLMDRGAPLDLFAAAMLGELAIVKAVLDARPALARVPGPHGIPLLAHAKAGGAQAAAVLDYIGGVVARLGSAA